MKQITIDFSRETGRIKPMHAVNNGPMPDCWGQSFFEAFKEAGIPYIRNHDAAFSDVYGGEHIVDVENIFTDFSADENDPSSYDFELTDQYCQWNNDAGAAILYRLGCKIEQMKKKYHSYVPKDYSKYARVCGHIIDHLCFGWADGLHLDIPYWEIWNEPDCIVPGFTEVNCCWQGTQAEFREFYKVMSLHLKQKFPGLKIGGPAFTHITFPQEEDVNPYVTEFLDFVKEEKLPLDFFSFHGYETDARRYAVNSIKARRLLDERGLQRTELILDEWNYVKGWRGQDVIDTIHTEHGLKGAAFAAASMLSAQKSPLDMFMYYDLRPSCDMNGLFAPFTYECLKTYYVFREFNKLYRQGTEVLSVAEAPFFVAAAKNETGKTAQIAYYQEKDPGTETLEISLSGLTPDTEIKVFLLDREKDSEPVRCEHVMSTDVKLYFSVRPYDVYYLEIRQAEKGGNSQDG